MKKLIAVSAGHHPKRPGYKIHNTSEYSEMVVLAGMVVNKIERACHDAYLVGTGPLGKKIAEINEQAPDAAVELHLNAGGGHGYETLYCPGSVNGRALAQEVNSAIGLVLNSRNRGVKEGYYKMDKANGPDAFLFQTHCPAIIVEMFFLDNKEERAKFLGSLHIMDHVASRIAVGILSYLKGDKRP